MGKIVNTTDVDPEWLATEKEAEMKKEDLLSKPEDIREKIVEGRLTKLVSEVALMEQPYLRDPTVTVAEFIKQKTAETGEKISIRRFTQYSLGEGLEKRSDDFAAE